MYTFTKGQHVTYKDYKGVINFISEYYITITIREYNKPALEAEHAKSMIRQVNLCVYPKYWNEIHLTSPQVNDTFSTDNAEIVENIK